MATITRGRRDKVVGKIKEILDQYELAHPTAVATLYRQDSASVRVRIVDPRFGRSSKGARHDKVWKFISDRLDEIDREEVALLILLTPAEQPESFINSEFDKPIRSKI
jgi:stress-induced morphogen